MIMENITQKKLPILLKIKYFRKINNQFPCLIGNWLQLLCVCVCVCEGVGGRWQNNNYFNINTFN